METARLGGVAGHHLRMPLLPFEVWKLIRHPNELHWVVLAINILVVLYIAWVRWDEIRGGSPRACRTV